jgi:hypothetical protein
VRWDPILPYGSINQYSSFGKSPASKIRIFFLFPCRYEKLRDGLDILFLTLILLLSNLLTHLLRIYYRHGSIVPLRDIQRLPTTSFSLSVAEGIF